MNILISVEYKIQQMKNEIFFLISKTERNYKSFVVVQFYLKC